ncbi:L-lactate permease [Galbitalea sp. SE-J8]|uniref:L-lactate permease n=1 Tax=Galbitalea sp. SE-J8 TaxID=3054952 RepID=UPI00259CB179|nr:L-lactate permease [Galbitalea sp. SE-J8]MDM4762982.1 L-lactate permease [Galbitalea sp. SE-J8]
MFHQILDPLTNLWLSGLVALVPVIVLLVLLAGLRWKAQWASLVTLAVGLGLAVLVWRMPVVQAVSASLDGTAQGVLNNLWLVFNAIWIHSMTVKSGHFEILRRTFAGLSNDLRIAAIIIAFGFGTLLEALAGSGAPVAICAGMLISLGLNPMKAIVASLVANTAPVAFGGLGNPVTMLGRTVQLTDGTGISAETFGAMIGRQTPFLAVLIPFVLLLIVDGRRGVKEVWPAALVGGVVFGAAQYLLSNHFSYQLTDIFSALIATFAVVIAARAMRARSTMAITEAVSTVGPRADDRGITGLDRLVAFGPYLIVIAVFSCAQIPGIKDWLATLQVTFPWPALSVESATGTPVNTSFVLNWGSATGSLLFVAAVLTMVLLRVSVPSALAAYWGVLTQFGWAIVTILAVFSLSYLMNFSGMIITLGSALAQTGVFYALLAPVVGWVGVFITGTDTGANALFGQLQATAAQQVGASPVLFGAANTTGGAMAKMVSPQNLAVGAAAVGLVGREGELLRRVIGWSLLFLALTCILVFLQSTPILGWMVNGL